MADALKEGWDEPVPHADAQSSSTGTEAEHRPQPVVLGNALAGEGDLATEPPSEPVQQPVPGTEGPSTEFDVLPFLDQDPEEIGTWFRQGLEENIVWIAQVLGLIIVWWSAAVSITLLVKWTVGNYESDNRQPYPYPFAITSSVNLVTMFLACCLSQVLDKKSSVDEDEPRPSWQRSEVFKMLSIGVIQGAELGCNNKAIEFMPVSEKVMFHSMFVLFVMVFARMWGLEMLGWRRLTAGFFILMGGVLQGLGGSEHNSHATKVHAKGHAEAASDDSDQRQIGWIITVVAMLLGAQRWVLIQMVVQRSPRNTALARMSKLQYTSRTLPVAGVVCFILACIFEEKAFDLRRVDSTALPFSVPAISVFIMCLTIAELGLVHRTSAVALQVLATLHQIPIVVVSSIVFNERISALSEWGFRLCIVGALVYSWAYRLEAKARARENKHAVVEGDAEPGEGGTRELPDGAKVEET